MKRFGKSTFNKKTFGNGLMASDQTPPSKPTNLQATNIQDTSFLLSWTASTDLVGIGGYRVYLNNLLIGNTNNTSLPISNLTQNTTYSVYVIAYDTSGNLSGASNTLQVTTNIAPDTIAPTAPSGLQAINIDITSFDLLWNSSTDNVGVTGYKIYLDGLYLADSILTSYEITGLTANSAYDVTVRAYDAAGNLSVPSSILQVTTLTIPYSVQNGATYDLRCTGSTTTTIDLRWNKHVYLADTYNIYVDAVLVADNISIDTYQLTGLTEGTTYDIQVAAVVAAVEQPLSDIVKVTTARTEGSEYMQASGIVTRNNELIANIQTNIQWSRVINRNLNSAFNDVKIMIRRYDNTYYTGVDAEFLASKDVKGTTGYEVLAPTVTGDTGVGGSYEWVAPSDLGAVYRVFLLPSNNAGLSQWHPGPILTEGEYWRPGAKITPLWYTDDVGTGTVTLIEGGVGTVKANLRTALEDINLNNITELDDGIRIDGVVRSSDFSSVNKCKINGADFKKIRIYGGTGPETDSIRSSLVLSGSWTNEGSGKYSISIPATHTVVPANSLWVDDFPLKQAGTPSFSNGYDKTIMGYSNWTNNLYGMNNTNMVKGTFYWDTISNKIWVRLPNDDDPINYTVEIGYGNGALTAADIVTTQTVLRKNYSIENLTLAHCNLSGITNTQESILTIGSGWVLKNVAIIGGSTSGLLHYGKDTLIDNVLIDGTGAAAYVVSNISPVNNWLIDSNHTVMSSLTQRFTISGSNNNQYYPLSTGSSVRSNTVSHYHERRGAIIPRTSITFNTNIESLTGAGWFKTASRNNIIEECYYKDCIFGIRVEAVPDEWIIETGDWSVEARNITNAGVSQYYFDNSNLPPTSRIFSSSLLSAHKAMMSYCTDLDGTGTNVPVGGVNNNPRVVVLSDYAPLNTADSDEFVSMGFLFLTALDRLNVTRVTVGGLRTVSTDPLADFEANVLTAYRSERTALGINYEPISALADTNQTKYADYSTFDLNQLPNISAIIDEVKLGATLLNWGILTEYAVMCRYLELNDPGTLSQVKIISHASAPSNVNNCFKDADACTYLHALAAAGDIEFYELGLSGAKGIDDRNGNTGILSSNVLNSAIGALFNYKWFSGKPDFSDCMTLVVLAYPEVFGANYLATLTKDGTDNETTVLTDFQNADGKQRLYDIIETKAALAISGGGAVVQGAVTSGGITVGGGQIGINQPGFQTTTTSQDCIVQNNIVKVIDTTWSNILVIDPINDAKGAKADYNMHLDAFSGSNGFNYNTDKSSYEASGMGYNDIVGTPKFLNKDKGEYYVLGGADIYGASVLSNILPEYNTAQTVNIIAPTQDAHINESDPATTHETATPAKIRYHGGSFSRTYYQTYDLTNEDLTALDSVILRIYTSLAGTADVQVFETTTYDAATLTYNNAPPLLAGALDVVNVSDALYHEFDITDHVKKGGNKIYHFGFWASPDNTTEISVNTLESVSDNPEMVITTGRNLAKDYPLNIGFDFTGYGLNFRADNLDIYKVTNLNTSGAGSFADAVSASNRIIVFEVSGSIDIDELTMSSSNIIIAGQTAPSPGIQLVGRLDSLTGSNVLIQHLTVFNDLETDTDAINIGTDVYRINSKVVLDHCYLVNAGDEQINIWDNQGGEFTFRYCIFGPSGDSQAKNYGGLFGGDATYGSNFKVTLDHCLFMHNKDRNPLAKADVVTINNCIMYNWADKAVYVSSREPTNECNANVMGCVFIPGPNTTNAWLPIKLDPTGWVAGSKVYVSGNLYEGHTVVNQWGDLVSEDGVLNAESATSIDLPNPLYTRNASLLEDHLLVNIGPRPGDRYVEITTLLNQLANRNGAIISNPVTTPTLANNSSVLTVPSNTDYECNGYSKTEAWLQSTSKSVSEGGVLIVTPPNVGSLATINLINPIGFDYAKHLIRRSSLSGSFSEIDRYATLTIDDALNDLFSNQTGPIVTGTETNTDLDNQFWDLLEKSTPDWYGKMVMFMFSMLPATIVGANNKDRRNWFRLLYESVTRSYKDTIEAVSRDHNMGRRLNIADNVVGAPNENYARELFELFTLSPGELIAPGNYTYYTENDIREAARVLTGFRRTTLNDNMNSVGSLHDTGGKTFSAAFSNTFIPGQSEPALELPLLVNMIFSGTSQDRVAEFLCTKLYRYYVSDDLDVGVIGEMADLFLANNFEFEPVLKALFKSQHFYEQRNTASKFMSPIELTTYCSNYFNGSINRTTYSRTNGVGPLVDMGQPYFDPPEIAGYPANYQAPDYNDLWIDSVTSQEMSAEALEIMIVNGVSVIDPIATSLDVDTAITDVYRYTNADPLDADVLEVLRNEMLEGSGNTIHWTEATPQERLDFLANLITALAFSGEFKVH